MEEAAPPEVRPGSLGAGSGSCVSCVGGPAPCLATPCAQEGVQDFTLLASKLSRMEKTGLLEQVRRAVPEP